MILKIPVQVFLVVKLFCLIDNDLNVRFCIDQDPENMSAEPRKFNFDFSYWSHDGFKEESNGYMIPDKSQPNGSKYADQVKFYDTLVFGQIIFCFH